MTKINHEGAEGSNKSLGDTQEGSHVLNRPGDGGEGLARPADQALMNAAPAGLRPSGFDPSRSAADSIPGYTEFIEGLAKALADVPQPPIFASSALFPNDSAMKFSHEKRDYLLAGPKFWAQMPVGSGSTDPFALGSINIIDVDHPRERHMRAIVMQALCAAMDDARDSDRSGEAVETTGSTEGESAGRRHRPTPVAPQDNKER